MTLGFRSDPFVPFGLILSHHILTRLPISMCETATASLEVSRGRDEVCVCAGRQVGRYVPPGARACLTARARRANTCRLPPWSRCPPDSEPRERKHAPREGGLLTALSQVPLLSNYRSFRISTRLPNHKESACSTVK